MKPAGFGVNGQVMDGGIGSQHTWQQLSRGYRQGDALWDEVHR